MLQYKTERIKTKRRALESAGESEVAHKNRQHAAGSNRTETVRG